MVSIFTLRGYILLKSPILFINSNWLHWLKSWVEKPPHLQYCKSGIFSQDEFLRFANFELFHLFLISWRLLTSCTSLSLTNHKSVKEVIASLTTSATTWSSWRGSMKLSCTWQSRAWMSWVIPQFPHPAHISSPDRINILSLPPHCHPRSPLKILLQTLHLHFPFAFFSSPQRDYLQHPRNLLHLFIFHNFFIFCCFHFYLK